MPEPNYFPRIGIFLAHPKQNLPAQKPMQMQQLRAELIEKRIQPHHLMFCFQTVSSRKVHRVYEMCEASCGGALES